MKLERECQRKAGELLKQMEKSKGSKGNQYTEKLDRLHDATSPTLKDLGIHRLQSQRWQQIAESHGGAESLGNINAPTMGGFHQALKI